MKIFQELRRRRLWRSDRSNQENTNRSNEGSSKLSSDDAFECNICLDEVSNPVVTLCGHLYCWGCLYKWLSAHNTCPVCKAGVTKSNVIPVYTRGSEQMDPREKTKKDSVEIPHRPPGQRPPVEERHIRGILRLVYQQTDVNRSPFPSLFGLQFLPFLEIPEEIRGTPEGQKQFRLLLAMYFLAFFVLLCWITF